MAPKTSPEKSNSAQNRRLLKKMNKMYKIMKKLNRRIDRLQDSVEELRNPPAPAAQPHAGSSSGQRRKLQLSFVCKPPTQLFTANPIYAIDDGTKTNVPVRVVLVDEGHQVVTEGPLSSLKLEVFVAQGDFKVEESQDWTTKEAETSRVPARKDKGPLLLGNCGGTMEKGSCTFNGLKFGDNSSWVPTRTFRLVANVAESARMPDMVDIRPAISEPFAVKDQRGKQYEKHSVPSRDDEVWRIRRIGKDGHKKLEDEGVRTVEDFLRRYYMDQSWLRKILGAKDGAWATIVEHAKECKPNNEGFQYASPESKVKLLFDCFYKLEWVAFDGQSYHRFHDLAEDDKSQVEHLRLRAFEDQTKLVHIKSLSEIIYAKTNQNILVPDPNPQHPVDPVDNKFLLEVEAVPEDALWDAIEPPPTYQHATASTMEVDSHLLCQQELAVADPPPPDQGGCNTSAEPVSATAMYSGVPHHGGDQFSAPKFSSAANANSEKNESTGSDEVRLFGKNIVTNTRGNEQPSHLIRSDIPLASHEPEKSSQISPQQSQSQSQDEQLRLRVFEDQTKLVQIKCLSEIIPAKTNQDISDPNPQHPVAPPPQPESAMEKFVSEGEGIHPYLQGDVVAAPPPPYQDSNMSDKNESTGSKCFLFGVDLHLLESEFDPSNLSSSDILLPSLEPEKWSQIFEWLDA